MKKNLNLKVGLAVLVLILIPHSKTAQAQRQNALTTDRDQTTITVVFACEGTNCAGLTIDNTAGGVALTAANYNPTVTDQPAGFSRAQRADCTNSGAKIWITANGSITLAASKGQPINDGGQFTIYGYTNIANFKGIRDAGTSSTLYCDYSRQP